MRAGEWSFSPHPRHIKFACHFSSLLRNVIPSITATGLFSDGQCVTDRVRGEDKEERRGIGGGDIVKESSE